MVAPVDEWEWSADEWEIVCLGQTPYEFDFFARDLDGRVAMFATYNTGPIPSAVLRSRERFNGLLRSIVGLPPTGGVIEEKEYGGDWVLNAQRGLFAYDNGDVHHPQQKAYERVACPTLPLVVEDIGLDASAIESLPLIEVRFVEAVTIPFDRIPR